MKHFKLILLLIITALDVKAQSNVSGTNMISGKVTDAATKQPVDFATVSVFKQGNTSPFNGSSTDPKGNFMIDNLAAGDYNIAV